MHRDQATLDEDGLFDGPNALGRREDLFPVVRETVFMSHAAVCPLPSCAAEAMIEFAQRGTRGAHENEWTAQCVRETRASVSRLLSCEANEIALLGPTALGLSLIAQGLDWSPGDEVVYYPDDYPSNVYPWKELERCGVKPVAVRPSAPGLITWEVLEPVISPKTRLVSLATCNFLSGYRIDVDVIGRELHERGVLFCLDAIQTLGAFPITMKYVDFLSADSHKWLLGPCGAGIVYVRKELQPRLRPILLGAWNVHSPDFVAQDEIRFYEGGRRYEPGAINLSGIIGMRASLDLLISAGIERVGRRILALRRRLIDALRSQGFEGMLDAWDLGPEAVDDNRSGIVTVRHPERDMRALFKSLSDSKVVSSYRRNRSGQDFIRFSPHFYNNGDDLDTVSDLLARQSPV
jgi:cysteine desulfurase/selenocysteine lyase